MQPQAEEVLVVVESIGLVGKRYGLTTLVFVFE
jgi:hypothetical protein